MKEVVFKVKKDSDFYNNYFKSWNEQQKFHTLARQFFKKYDLMDKNMLYYQSERLSLSLTDTQKEQFKGQIHKHADKNGLILFNKNSKMQKEWNERVISKIDMKSINSFELWYFGIISKGRYALWHYNDEIYGYLYDSYKDKIDLPDYAIQIKASEYFSILEECEQHEKEGK